MATTANKSQRRSQIQVNDDSTTLQMASATKGANELATDGSSSEVMISLTTILRRLRPITTKGEPSLSVSKQTKTTSNKDEQKQQQQHHSATTEPQDKSCDSKVVACCVDVGAMLLKQDDNSRNNNNNECKSIKLPAQTLVKSVAVAKGRQQQQHYNCQRNNNWLASAILVAIVSTLLVDSFAIMQQAQHTVQLAEAKMHHSKRQAPIAQQPAAATLGAQAPNSPATGREGTNWWNIWWQRKFQRSVRPLSGSISSSPSGSRILRDDYGDNDDDDDDDYNDESDKGRREIEIKTPISPPKTNHYRQRHLTPSTKTEYINEAVEPTVRPIVAVSYGDQSIKIGNSASRGEQFAANDDNGDDLSDRTNMVPEARDHPDGDSAPELRSGARQRTGPDAVDPIHAKQMLLAHKKSMQHQAHWLSVKPTIIQPTGVGRDGRANRQTTVRQVQVDDSESQVDQANYGIQMRNSAQQQQQQQRQVLSNGPSRPQQQATWRQPANNNFMQQQQVILDDMRFEQQQNQMLDYTEEADVEPGADSPVSPPAADDAEPEEGARAKGVDSSSSSMMAADQQQQGNRRPPTQVKSTASVQQQQQQPRAMRPQTTAATTTTSRARANNEPTTSQIGETTNAGGQQTTASLAPTSTTLGRTQAPIATTTTTVAPTAKTTIVSTSSDTTEPTSPGSAFEERDSASGTTSGGRVQLENGRPANGMRQVGVTSAARIPTISTVQPTTTTTLAPAASTTPPPTTVTTATATSTASPISTTTTTPALATITTTTAAPTTAAQSQQPGTTTTTTTTTASGDATTSIGTSKPTESSQTTTTTATPISTEGKTSEVPATVSTTGPATDTSDSTEGGADDTASSTATDSPSGSDDSDDDEEDSTGDESATPAPANGTSAAPTITTTTTTQSPTAATVELERLPKNQQATTGPAGMSLMREASDNLVQQQQQQQQEAQRTTGDDIARIRLQPQSTGSSALDGAPTATRVQDDSMPTSTTIGRMPVGDETAITMPMESLINMMNQLNAAEQENQRAATSVGLSGDLSSSTTPATPAPLPAAHPTSTRSPQLGGVRMNVDFGERTTVNQQQQQQQSDATTRRRLQPPPTTQMPSQTSRQQQHQQQQQSGGRTTSSSVPSQTSLIDGASDGPMSVPPKMVMVSVQSPMMNGIAPLGGRDEESRTEMMNLDLMPIQRIMGNQMAAMMQQQRQNEFDNRMNNKQRPMIELESPEVSGEQQVDKPVEPGMRLRPPKQQANNAEMVNGRQRGQMQQQQSAIVMGNQNPANTVYMLMMGANQAPSEETKRPRPPVQMTTMQQQQLPATFNPTTTTTNQQQRERLMTTKSADIAAPAPPTTTKTKTTGARRQQMSTTLNLPITTVGANQLQMTTTGGQFTTRTQPATMTTKGATRAQSATTVAATQPTTGRPRFVNEMQIMSMTEMEIKRQREQMEGRLSMLSSEQQTSGPMTTTLAAATTTKSAKLQQGTTIAVTDTMSTTQMPIRTTDMRGENLTSSDTVTTQKSDQSQTLSTTNSPITTTTNVPTTTTAAPAVTASTSAPTTSTTTAAPTTTIMVTSSTQESNQNGASQTPATTTTTNAQRQPISTTSRQSDSVTTANPSTTQQTSTVQQQQQQTSTTLAAVQQQQPTTTTTTTTVTLTAATTERPTSNNRQQSANEDVAGSGGSQQLDRIQQQQPQSQRQPNAAAKTASRVGKVGGKQANQTSALLSSSFIPPKLRNDFNRLNRNQATMGDNSERQQVPTTTQSPLTNVAIRQFGGANRMSLLGNQPVPFGRPAAMTMRSATPSRLQVGTNYRIELPSFEYGPAIAVRRPDEPLANGQVPNCTLTGKNFCVLTKDYPMNEVRQAVERSFRSVRIMYEELQTVSDQELHKDDFNATNNQAATGKFACQTQVEMMRPGWAKDEITKEWMLVVNTDVFPQRVRTESCAQPNTPCEFIAPFYDSTCQQRYSLHRMIAIDPHDPSRSPQVAVFRFPAGCVCRVHPIRKTTTTTSSTTPATRR